MYEETGIDVPVESFLFLGTKSYKDWFTDSFYVKMDVPLECLKLQDSEVTNAKWVDVKEFIDMCDKELIVPFTMERFYAYKDQLGL